MMSASATEGGHNNTTKTQQSWLSLTRSWATVITQSDCTLQPAVYLAAFPNSVAVHRATVIV